MRRKLAVILALLIALASFTPALADEAFEGFEGMVIIGKETRPGGAKGGSDPQSGGGGELSMEIGTARVTDEWDGKKDETHLWVFVDIHVTNWMLETVTVSESLKTTLTYQGEYDYQGTPIFSRDKLGMLEELYGQVVFRVPAIAAFAGPDALTLTAVSGGNIICQPLDIVQEAAPLKEEMAIPFDHVPQNDVLDVAVKEPLVFDKYRGQSDEVSKWVLIPVQLINRSYETLPLTEETLTARLVYDNTYGFVGSLNYGRSALEPLECIVASLFVRVPTLVTKAPKGKVELWLDSEELELCEPIDMTGAAERATASREAYRDQYAVGKVVRFGSYEQDNDLTNGKEPIEWIVVANDDETVTLLSRCVLENIRYNSKNEPVTWATCLLRAWLNDGFLNEAFTEDEQAQLVNRIVYAQNPDNNTEDRVFIAAQGSIDAYIGTEVTRYAGAKGVRSNSYWYRSTGDEENAATHYYYQYYVHQAAKVAVDHVDIGVRPMITLQLYWPEVKPWDGKP